MSTPEDTPSPEKKPEDVAAADAATPAGPKPTVAKPKFKVTRSPFAPKIEGAPGIGAPKPGPVTLPKDGGAPKPVAPKPMAPKAAAPKAPAPNPMAGAVSAAPKPGAAPVAGAPKPVAPVSARKAAEMAEEEDSKFSPILMAVDAIAAIVAIAFGVLIILGMKG